MKKNLPILASFENTVIVSRTGKNSEGKKYDYLQAHIVTEGGTFPLGTFRLPKQCPTAEYAVNEVPPLVVQAGFKIEWVTVLIVLESAGAVYNVKIKP